MRTCILFDFDGTIVDSSEGITTTVQYALGEMGIEEHDLKKLELFIGPPLIDSFMNLYGMTEDQAKQAIAIYRNRYKVTCTYQSKLYPGTREMLASLKEAGFLIGIASSKPEPTCKLILEYLGIMDYFNEITGATFDGTRSSKESVLIEALRRWEPISKDRMLLVGDTMYDVEGAAKVGLPCLAVSFGFGNVEEMKEAGAIGVCDSMEELTGRIISGIE